jgi:hypothetical protein
MVQEKVIYINRIKSILKKIEDLISFYEKQSIAANDAACASFLKNVADKKSIQLTILERMMRKQGIEIISLKENERRETSFYGTKLFEKSIEDIFNFISKQSLNDLKALSFFSMENRYARQLFKTMFELEEDFLVFVECDYLHHLAQSTARADFQRSQPEKAILASV